MHYIEKQLISMNSTILFLGIFQDLENRVIFIAYKPYP